MTRTTQEISVNEMGDEGHPAFGVIGASRGSSSGGEHNGTVLFDSDVIHRHTVRVRIGMATRKRDLGHDWIHDGPTYIEVEMSEAQWASFVSSMNAGVGVPCTVRYVNGEEVPEMPFDPRLAVSLQETRGAAERAFSSIAEAMDAYEALDSKTPASERRKALQRLRSAIDNAAPNVAYASKTLAGHAENVVAKARADVEAFVVAKSRQLGIDPGELVQTKVPSLAGGGEPEE